MPFLDSAKLFLYKKSLYSFLAFAVVVSVFMEQSCILATY